MTAAAKINRLRPLAWELARCRFQQDAVGWSAAKLRLDELSLDEWLDLTCHLADLAGFWATAATCDVENPAAVLAAVQAADPRLRPSNIEEAGDG